MKQLAPLALATLIAAFASPAVAQTLPSFKDKLYAYPPVISSAAGGDHRVLAYDENRDLMRRDEVPERRVQGYYVSLGVRRQQKDLVAETSAGPVRHFAVGKAKGASMIVVYLHGQGGSRKQGVDDHSFGGNFNRIKNLLVPAGGLYLVPDFPDFGAGGIGRVAALIDYYSAASPSAKVYVACGSMGGALCWGLARDPAIAAKLGGLLLLGSFPDPDFPSSAAAKARVPLMLAQGGSDKVFAAAKTEAFFNAIRSRAPGYPVKLVVFDKGTHGTPIRMIDWRETINWMAGR